MTDKDYNLLPLDAWRRIFGFNPWHFWGVTADVGNVRLSSNCADIITEYAWQDVDSAGREEIRQAIISAEAIIRTWAAFWPAPVYDEATVPWGRTVIMPDAHLQAIGVETRTLIGQATVAGGTLVYTDEFTNGVDDTFTITLPIPGSMTGLTTDEVAVYITAADRTDGAPIGERWRVAPLQVSISGAVLTITGRRWLCVLPSAYEGMDGEGLDATDATQFVTSLDVYRRTTDPDGTTAATSQAVAIWETRPCHGWWCGCGCQLSTTTPTNSSQDPAAIATALARAGIRDSETGLVHAMTAIRNATTGIWSAVPAGCWLPDRLTVRYLAGLPLVSGQMQSRWAQVVARLAAAELARPICACDSANKELYRWQFDLATATSEAEQYQFDQSDLANPLGTRRGHVQSWKWITRNEVVQGFIPG
jgi:hypothetical protein